MEKTSNSDGQTPQEGILRPAFVLFFALTILTGLVYPLLVTGVAQVAFPDKANGSLIYRDGRAVGSRLIGQAFTLPGYFWGRPSATQPVPYNAAASVGSNLGPTNPALLRLVEARVATLRAADPTEMHQPVPVALVTSSASGLDPNISLAAAYYQASRVAHARHVPVAQIRELIAQHARGVRFGFLGEPRVNVLELNLALDAATH